MTFLRATAFRLPAPPADEPARPCPRLSSHGVEAAAKLKNLAYSEDFASNCSARHMKVKANDSYPTRRLTSRMAFAQSHNLKARNRHSSDVLTALSGRAAPRDQK